MASFPIIISQKSGCFLVQSENGWNNKKNNPSFLDRIKNVFIEEVVISMKDFKSILKNNVKVLKSGDIVTEMEVESFGTEVERGLIETFFVGLLKEVVSGAQFLGELPGKQNNSQADNFDLNKDPLDDSWRPQVVMINEKEFITKSDWDIL